MNQSRIITVPFAVPVTASHTEIGRGFGVGTYDKIALVATLTGMSAGTLDLYIQESWDSGTSWYDVAHFTQIAAAAPAAKTRRVFTSDGTVQTIGIGDATNANVALGANKFCDQPWGPLLRIVSVTGAGVNAGPVTQTFTFIGWQQSA